MKQLRMILGRHGRLSVDIDRLSDDDDLYRAGLTSHASVTVMLACEEEFDVEFPNDLVRRSTFATLAAIAAALHSMGADLDSLAATSTR